MNTPKLQHVKIVPDGENWKIVTLFLAMPVQSAIPETPASGLSKFDAIQNAKVFDDYIKSQRGENARKSSRK